ncbi:alpha-(1,3)-fucosyltransferase C [Manduca sexta]|uniref:Fucosyltransferase n=1 Tax=Manduca sexta TaxID=7130 RepID=A0A921Z3I4_MANSE|nr:alpha-(1,3)-fucosyltransferase C [Manduca sexta]KAG6450281.1 hypothetical protein O3G_MSEX006460 [Manduca sexta]
MPNKYVKILYYCSILFLIVIVYVTLKDFLSNKNDHRNNKKIRVLNEETTMKYILQWTSPRNVPFVYMGVGQNGFIERKCPHVNCIVTADPNYLEDITKFDVIAFAGPEVVRMSEERLPKKRSPRQKYAFASIESSHNYPVCSNRFDNYFNWTWTYKLDSEVRWGYISIRDKDKKVVGPKKDMHWPKLEDMDPISDELKAKLKTKTKAAAWFVSNCLTNSKRERFVNDLKMELEKYKHVIDIYGRCGLMSCSRDSPDKCNKLIEDTYYFYLSFENSFAEDYVTEKLVTPLQNNAVPIVFGGGNYTRFMPDGIYLNARQLGVEKLAAKMNELIQNPEEYYKYFKWKNYYTYHTNGESVETNEYCRFCELLNDEKAVKTTSIYKDFREWWDPPGVC